MERSLRRLLRTFLILGTIYIALGSLETLMAKDPVFEGIIIKEIQAFSRARITTEVIRRITGLEMGQPYSAKTIRNSLDLLYETGLFKDIQVEAELVGNKVVLRYIFVEKAFLAGLDIKGNWAFFDRTLREKLDLRIGDEFSEIKLKRAISRLLTLYQRRGFFQTKVTSNIRRDESSNQIHAVLNVTEGVRARIQQTEFAGNRVFSNLRLFSLIRSLRGEYFDANRAEKDLNKLRKWYQSKGYLKSVIDPPEITYLPQTNEILLAFPIEAEARLEIQIEKLTAFRREKIISQLFFKEERSYDNSVFDASARGIEGFYKSNGYPFVKVEWSREEKPDDRSVIGIFVVDEGPLICLKSVSIEGNQFFSDQSISEALSVHPGYNPFYCKKVDPEILKEDIDEIQRIYQEEGFLEPKISVAFSYPEGVESLVKSTTSLIITIDEGMQTLVKEIVIVGNQKFSTGELLRMVNHRPGKAYHRITAYSDSNDLMHFYQNKGFIYSETKLKEIFSEDRSQVQLTYTIHEDRIAHFGRVFIEGNTFTRSYVIQREIQIKPGEPYNDENILFTRHHISQLGFLEDIRLQPMTPLSADPKEYIKDMRLRVRERPPKALEFGLGYGDFDRFRGFVQLWHKNLAGTGRSLRLRGEASQKEWKSSLTYVEPWLFSFPFDARLTGLYETQVRPSYDLTTIGASAGIDKNVTPRLKTSLVYQIEFDNFTDVPEAILDEEDEGRINIATVNPSLFFDSRPDPFNPKSGTLSGVTFRVGAKSLGSEVQLRKVTLISNWFFPLNRWAVLALSAQVGASQEFGESKEVPISERFFAGGRSTIRGYQQDELGVVGETIVPNDGATGVEFFGGNAVLISSVELRFFLPANLGIVLFHDRGNVWRTFHNVETSEMKSTIGGGVRYNTPVGPLRLDLGYKLDREDDLCGSQCAEKIEESQYEVHFTLGHAF